MNLQNLFDKVAQHLLTQNTKSLSQIGCAYRGANGTKCAVGCLIKDEFYHPKFENTLLDSSQVTAVVAKSLEGEADSSILTDRGNFTHEALSMLRALQTLHDQMPPADWPWALKRVAKHFNLEWNHEPAEPV